MNLQAILITNITGFWLIFVLFFSRFITRTKNDTEENAFSSMMGLTMIACVVEPVTFLIDGKPGSVFYWINLLGGTYLYYANGTGAFLWCMYVDLKLYHDRSRMKKIYYPASIPVGIMLLSLFCNIWGKYYFYVDENNVYHRQPLIYIFYVYILICSIYSIYLYLHYKHIAGRRATFFPIYMYLVPIITGSVSQMLFYGISLAWLGTAIGIVAMNTSMQNQKAYLDPLTGLYNRLYLEHSLFKIKSDPRGSYYGLMIDLNFFKAINDNYGHSAGDTALIEAADILRKNSENSSSVFRFAGDEFIIIVNTNDENDVLSIEDKIRDAAKEFNTSGKRPYELSFAIGHCKYNITDNEDSFLRNIDAAMYIDKARIHGGR